MKCRHCRRTNTRKNGKTKGKQRYLCKDCGRTFTKQPPKYSAKVKQKAIVMYLNNVGIRKAALFTGCSPTTILNWIREKHGKLKSAPEIAESDDIIEMDEIYTYCSKKNSECQYGLHTREIVGVLRLLRQARGFLRLRIFTIKSKLSRQTYDISSQMLTVVTMLLSTVSVSLNLIR